MAIEHHIVPQNVPMSAGILLFFLCISVLIFSSLIYYAEYEDEQSDAPARARKEPNKFTSIPASCWCRPRRTFNTIFHIKYSHAIRVYSCTYSYETSCVIIYYVNKSRLGGQW